MANTLVDQSIESPVIQETPTLTKNSFKKMLLFDLSILVALGAVIFWGAATQFSQSYNDATRYQCYAIAFWQGQAGLDAHGLEATSRGQCSFLVQNTLAATDMARRFEKRPVPALLVQILEAQVPPTPFHMLPPEYPLFTLIPFSIPTLAPFDWYQIVFALEMILVAALIYAVLVKYQGRPAAVAFAFYLALGSWATAAGRFDLVPAGLTLGAVMLAGKERWKWAFALLALATLTKFYPVIFVIPFLIAQQRAYKREKWLSAQRWSPLAVFIGLSVLVMLVSLACSIENSTLPFTYFSRRPLQIESFPAMLVWLGKLFGQPAQLVFGYQSVNIIGPLTKIISPLTLGVEVASMVYIFWLQWRGKLHMHEVGLMITLLLIITGKVFSPQYLIWVAPLIALVGRANWKWLLLWGLVCALTTFMFPLHYHKISEINHFYLVIVIRNLLVVAMTATLLLWYSKRKPAMVGTKTTASSDLQSD